jgi:hypothetical protein
MPLRTTKPLTRDQLLAYRLVAAVKKFIDPALGFLSIEMIPEAPAEGRFSFAFRVPARPDPGEPRGLRVGVYRNEVRVNFRRGRWARSGTFNAADPGFEREVAEFIGRHWNCYFSTYWMSL